MDVSLIDNITKAEIVWNPEHTNEVAAIVWTAGGYKPLTPARSFMGLKPKFVDWETYDRLGKILATM